MVTETVEIEGIPIRYMDVGEGPALLLIHGFLVSHLEWEALLPHLTPHFRCIAPDLPGCGKSGKPPASAYPYTREAFAQTLVQLLDALELERAHVCGHSMGGSLAITMASDHSDRIERLSLVDSACYPFDLPLKGRLPQLPIVGSFIFKHVYRRPIFRDYFRKEVFGGSPALNLDRVDAYYDDFTPVEGRDAAYAILKGSLADLSPIADKIRRIQAPTRVIWGEEDQIFPRSLAQRLASDIQDADLKLLAGCGHAPNEERPEDLAELLIEHHLTAS